MFKIAKVDFGHTRKSNVFGYFLAKEFDKLPLLLFDYSRKPRLFASPVMKAYNSVQLTNSQNFEESQEKTY